MKSEGRHQFVSEARRSQRPSPEHFNHVCLKELCPLSLTVFLPRHFQIFKQGYMRRMEVTALVRVWVMRAVKLKGENI